MAPFTLSDLAKMVSAKRRSVQLWAEFRVLAADPETQHSGSGVHRTFSRAEAIIACIIGVLSEHKISIGELSHIAGRIRTNIPNPSFSKIIEEAIAGREVNFIIYRKGSPQLDVWTSAKEDFLLQDYLIDLLSAGEKSLIIINLNECLASARNALGV